MTALLVFLVIIGVAGGLGCVAMLGFVILDAIGCWRGWWKPSPHDWTPR